MEESLIATQDKLSKKVIKRFSISYSEAKRLGITDEDLKYISEIDPNKFRISIPTFDKRRTKVEHNLLDAIKMKYEMLKQIESDLKDHQEKITTLNESKGKVTKYNLVRDGIELYLTERQKDAERGFIHITTYEQDVIDFTESKYLLDYGIYDVPINKIDKDYAQAFVNYLWDREATKGKNKGEKLSENTIYKPFSFIHKVFNYFKDELEIIDRNPFSKVKNKPQAVSKDKEYFTDEEMHYIKEKIEFENIRFRTVITVIMDTGLRREEALALKFSDINKFRETITINRAFVKSKIDNRYIIKKVKRKKSEREIVCPAYTLDMIDKYRKFKEACGFIVTDDDYIFTAWDSMELVDPDRHSKEFKDFLKKIEIKKDVPLKNLRHTHTTFFVSRNANLKAVQNRVGHEDIETTLGVYAQTNLNEDRKLVREYEEEFYNKLGLSVADVYRIVSNRFTDSKRLINILEKIGGEYIDDSNFDIQLERCQNYFRDLFPIIDKILPIDKTIDDDEIDSIFVGFSSLYRSIKIDTLEPKMKI